MSLPPSGIDMAREAAPEHTAVLDVIMPQLIIVLIKRLGGKVDIPISEMDDTGQDLLAFRINEDGSAFEFQILKKS